MVLLSFIFQELAFASAHVLPKAAQGETEAKDSRARAKSLLPSIPESVATIEDAYKAPHSKKTIILIQDAHTNNSAQLNTARAMDYIFKKEPIRYVFLEAGSGDESLAFLRKYAPQAKRKQVADSFLMNGKLQGVEYLNLTSDHNFVLWGVEDLSLYAKSAVAYRAVAEKRAALGEYLSQIDSTLRTLKPKIFNPFLLAFDEKYQKYQRGAIPLSGYHQTLESERIKLGISQTAYLHLNVLKKIKEIESTIDFKKASEEERAAIDSLVFEDRNELLGASEKNREPYKLSGDDRQSKNAFFALLEEKLGGDLGKYAELSKYLQYLNQAKDIEVPLILQEQKALEKEIFKALIRNQDEEDLIGVSKKIDSLKKLLHLTLTPDEFDEYQKGRQSLDLAQLTGFLNQKIMKLKNNYEKAIFLEAGHEDVIKRCEEFYSLTYQRDRIMIGNLTRKMNAEGQEKAILVAGGYHSPNLKALLKEQNFSYISLTPQVLQETDQKRYEALLLEPMKAWSAPSGLAAKTHTHMPPRIYAASLAQSLQAILTPDESRELQSRLSKLREAFVSERQPVELSMGSRLPGTAPTAPEPKPEWRVLSETYRSSNLNDASKKLLLKSMNSVKITDLVSDTEESLKTMASLPEELAGEFPGADIDRVEDVLIGIILSLGKPPEEREKEWDEAIRNLSKPEPLFNIYLTRYFVRFFAWSLQYYNRLESDSEQEMLKSALLSYANAVDPSIERGIAKVLELAEEAGRQKYVFDGYAAERDEAEVAMGHAIERELSELQRIYFSAAGVFIVFNPDMDVTGGLAPITGVNASERMIQLAKNDYILEEDARILDSDGRSLKFSDIAQMIGSWVHYTLGVDGSMQFRKAETPDDGLPFFTALHIFDAYVYETVWPADLHLIENDSGGVSRLIFGRLSLPPSEAIPRDAFAAPHSDTAVVSIRAAWSTSALLFKDIEKLIEERLEPILRAYQTEGQNPDPVIRESLSAHLRKQYSKTAQFYIDSSADAPSATPANRLSLDLLRIYTRHEIYHLGIDARQKKRGLASTLLQNEKQVYLQEILEAATLSPQLLPLLLAEKSIENAGHFVGEKPQYNIDLAEALDSLLPPGPSLAEAFKVGVVAYGEALSLRAKDFEALDAAAVILKITTIMQEDFKEYAGITSKEIGRPIQILENEAQKNILSDQKTPKHPEGSRVPSGAIPNVDLISDLKRAGVETLHSAPGGEHAVEMLIRIYEDRDVYAKFLEYLSGFIKEEVKGLYIDPRIDAAAIAAAMRDTDRSRHLNTFIKNGETIDILPELTIERVEDISKENFGNILDRLKWWAYSQGEWDTGKMIQLIVQNIEGVMAAWVVKNSNGNIIGVKTVEKPARADVPVYIAGVSMGIVAVLHKADGKIPRRLGIGRRLNVEGLRYLQNLPDKPVRFYRAIISSDNKYSFRSFHRAATELNLPVMHSGGGSKSYLVDLFPDDPISGALSQFLPPPLPANTDEAWPTVTGARSPKAGARVGEPRRLDLAEARALPLQDLTTLQQKAVASDEVVTFIVRVHSAKNRTGKLMLGSLFLDYRENADGSLTIQGLGEEERTVKPGEWAREASGEQDAFRITFSMADFKEALDRANARVEEAPDGAALNGIKAVGVIDLEGLSPDVSGFDEVVVPLLIEELKLAHHRPWGQGAKFLLKGNEALIQRVFSRIPPDQDFVVTKEEDLGDYADAPRILITTPGNHQEGLWHFFIQKIEEGDIPNFRGALRGALSLARVEKLETTDKDFREIMDFVGRLLGRQMTNPSEYIRVTQDPASVNIQTIQKLYSLSAITRLPLQQILQGARLAVRMVQQAT